MSSEPPSIGSKTKRPAPPHTITTTTTTTSSSESPPPPPLGSSATDVGSTAAAQAPPHKRVKHDARTRKKMAQEAAADDEPQIDRRAPRAGGFGELLGDILSLVCVHLDTRHLLTLRRVNAHWSRWSRLPRSWVSSHWRFVEAAGVASETTLPQMCESAPYLRSLHLPEYWPHSRATALLEVLVRLQSLESLHFHDFGHDTQCQPDNLLQQLPNLRHVASYQIAHVADYQQHIHSICARLPGLMSLREVDESVCLALGRSVAASTSLLALNIASTYGQFELSPFSALEVVEIGVSWNDEQDVRAARAIHSKAGWIAPTPLTPPSFSVLPCLTACIQIPPEAFTKAVARALGTAPALRVLMIRFRDDETAIGDGCIDALLSSQVLARRLEYLAIEGRLFGRASMRRIMEECTSLLSLHLGEFDEEHTSTCYRPLTHDEWAGLEVDPTLDPSKVRVGQADQPLRSDQFDISLFLLGPSAFRQRLLSLSLLVECFESDHASSSSISGADVQLRRRMPNLVHVDIREESASPSVPDVSYPWLNQVPSERPPAAHADQRQTTRDWSQQRLDDFRKLSPFQLVRRLKQMADLPLTDSEKDPNTRWI